MDNYFELRKLNPVDKGTGSQAQLPNRNTPKVAQETQCYRPSGAGISLQMV